MSLEQELRDTLRRAADDVGPAHPEAGMREEGMRALAHRHSRRRVAVLSAGLAVLVIGVGIPTGLSLVKSADNSVATPAPSPLPRSEPTPSADIFGGPTRGSLAGAAEFVEAVRQLPWAVDGSSLATEPPVESRRVVFAGDVPQGRWALVIGEATVLTRPTGDAPESIPAGETPDSPQPSGEPVTGIWGTWFTGTAGADPAQMQLVKDFPISADLPASLYNPITGAFVVVAAPGDLIEVSARPEVAADGTVNRNYLDNGTSDGVAVTAVQPAPFSRAGIAVQYRVSRSGVVLEEGGPSGVEDGELPEPPQIEIDYLRPPLSDAFGREERAFVQSEAATMLGEYGLRPDEVTVQVPYYGPISSLLRASMSLSVFTVTFPSGAVFTRTVDFSPGLMHEPGCFIDNISPAGSPAAQRSIAIRCDVDVPSAESSLIVIVPADFSGGYAAAEGSAGSVRVDLDGEGVGMIAFPEGATNVAIFAADGTAGDEVPILTA